MVGHVNEERNKNSMKVSVHSEYYRPTMNPTPGVLALACIHVSPCSILMSEGLVKLMWMSLPPGVNGALKSSSGGILGPGDGGDDSQEELDEESK